MKIPNGRYRSRLVAKEFNDGMGETMHAALPPLGEVNMRAAKFAAREQPGDTMANPDGDSCTVMVHMDVIRAYFTHTLCQNLTLSYRKKIRQGKSECLDTWSRQCMEQGKQHLRGKVRLRRWCTKST